MMGVANIQGIVKKILHDKSWFIYDIMSRNGFIEQTNVNLNLCDKSQKRILICYIPIPNIDFSRIVHAQTAHINQIIYAFVKRGFCVDVCYANDMQQYARIANSRYDVIFGFGETYKQACKDNADALKISFIMENHPNTVVEKYQERINNFHQRHPDISTKDSFTRTGYFDTEQFRLSDAGILMNSRYNALNFNEFDNKYLGLVNSNSIFNENFQFERDKIKASIACSRKSFLWFGSAGLIHKGLDIVIDSFRAMPELTLNCYGLNKTEYSLFNKIKAANTINHGRINVMSNDFASKVVMKHNFMILDSCSEGMSTSVSTCMAHGIIPIISKECGFEKAPCIIQLEDNSVDGVSSAVRRTFEMSDEEILDMREECYNYAKKEFSLNHFNEEFNNKLDEVLYAFDK